MYKLHNSGINKVVVVVVMVVVMVVVVVVEHLIKSMSEHSYYQKKIQEKVNRYKFKTIQKYKFQKRKRLNKQLNVQFYPKYMFI